MKTKKQLVANATDAWKAAAKALAAAEPGTEERLKAAEQEDSAWKEALASAWEAAWEAAGEAEMWNALEIAAKKSAATEAKTEGQD